MKIVIFCHSLVSDWNHGNAHFLRGIAAELLARGHRVEVYEPADAWSRKMLLREEGRGAEAEFHAAFPALSSTRFDYDTIDLDAVFDDADLVLVHEWNEYRFIARLGRHSRGFPRTRLLFHDTHHRAATAPDEIAGLELSDYHGVLAFGRVIRDIYLERGWTRRAWVWHEAADTNVFHPHPELPRDRDVVWIGNWGDDERTRELEEFLLEPARVLELRSTIHGVRYPRAAQRKIAEAGFSYRGWIANHEVPKVFARHRATVHIPRRPYVRSLPGVPTIRVFEALACGIPLVCSPWEDAEGLFEPGRDFLIARDGEEMQTSLKELLNEPAFAAEVADRGRRTILERHTCAHRADELLQIYAEVA